MELRNHRFRFKSIQFVTSTSSDASGQSSQECINECNPKTPLDGNEIKQFYEEVVHGDSEKGKNAELAYSRSSKCHAKQKIKSCDTDSSIQGSDREKLSDCEKHRLNCDLLFSSQNGDLKNVKKLVRKGADLNTKDMFGWTPIMCACHSGSYSVTEYLLSLGARTDFKNSQGRTASDLAKITSHQNILNLLSGQGEKKTTVFLKETSEKFFCDICGQEFSAATKRQHESSTIHLFNTSKPPQPVVYQIPESNPGFQLMVKGGWDTEKGLGPTGQGRKFPVKTTLKLDRAGIGIVTDAKPRITHPAPQISDEGKKSKKHSRDGSNSHKLIKKKDKSKDKQWERRLRIALTLN